MTSIFTGFFTLFIGVFMVNEAKPPEKRHSRAESRTLPVFDLQPIKNTTARGSPELLLNNFEDENRMRDEDHIY
jgi:hypothetical protein